MCNQHRFSTKIVVDKECTTNILSIAENFNKCFTEIGPNLANKINIRQENIFMNTLKNTKHANQKMLFL